MTAMTSGHGASVRTAACGATGTSPRAPAAGSPPAVPLPPRAAAVALATALLLAGCGAAAAQPTATPTHTTASASLVAPPGPATGAAGGTTTYPLTLKDDAGRTVTIKARPLRIISITLGTDEILPALVAKSRIVGVTAFASDATMSFAAGEVGGIAQFAKANAEQAIALKPDVVFASSYTAPGVVKQMADAGIPVVEFTGFSSLADIEAHSTTIATISDDQGRGKALVAAMQREVAAVEGAVASQAKPRVVFYSYGTVYGSGTTMDELIRAAGGINAAAAAGIHSWKDVGPEEIVQLNPDVLLTDDSGTGDTFQGAAVQKILADPAYKGVKAVQSKAVWGLSGRADSDVSQYMAWDVQDVASILHPGQVKAYRP